MVAVAEDYGTVKEYKQQDSEYTQPVYLGAPLYNLWLSGSALLWFSYDSAPYFTCHTITIALITLLPWKPTLVPFTHTGIQAYVCHTRDFVCYY